MCKFDRRDDRYEIVIENIADLVHHALRRDSLGLPALTPAISLTDPQDRQRTLSIGSFQSSSGPSPGSAWNSSQESLHLGMPTFGEGEYDQNQQVAYEPVSGPVTIMPFGSNPDFIGRERIFESIKNTLEAESNGQRRVALYGMGGVGFVEIASGMVKTNDVQEVSTSGSLRLLVSAAISRPFDILDTLWNS